MRSSNSARSVAEELFGLRVDQHDAPVLADQHHRVRRNLQQRAEPLVGVLTLGGGNLLKAISGQAGVPANQQQPSENDAPTDPRHHRATASAYLQAGRARDQQCPFRGGHGIELRDQFGQCSTETDEDRVPDGVLAALHRGYLDSVKGEPGDLRRGGVHAIQSKLLGGIITR